MSLEFNLKISPERAKLLHDNLVIEISGYEDRIVELQKLRQEAANQLADVKTVLMNNGLKPLELELKPTAKGLPPVDVTESQTPAAEGDETPPVSKQRYSKEWSMRDKVVFMYLKEGGDPEWTTDDIRMKLLKQEPAIEKMNSLSTTMVQNTGKAFERINKNGSKPLYKLMKGVTLLERYKYRT